MRKDATKIMRLYRKANNAFRKGHRNKARFYQLLIRLIFSAEIPYSAKLGQGVDLVHGGLGCVIHDEAIIGENTRIFQNVTIAGGPDGGVPIIGKNVYIGSGAVILGGVTIGDGAKIGANAVVLKDVPIGATAVGVPAVIKHNK